MVSLGDTNAVRQTALRTAVFYRSAWQQYLVSIDIHGVNAASTSRVRWLY
jgi:hypothetical protein